MWRLASAARQVGRVGQLQVFPNVPNVIPGRVKHSIELRDRSAEKMNVWATRSSGERSGLRTRPPPKS